MKKIQMFTPQNIIKNAISDFEEYCDGFGNSNNTQNNYLLGVVLGAASVPLYLNHEGSTLLDEINAFDKAEVEDTNIGQINMITVSSFCGISGLIWGLDLVKVPNIHQKHPLLTQFIKHNGKNIPLYSIQPIIEATRSLFGSVKNKRFPIKPGAHVPCAGKNIKAFGPSRIYSAIAIGIPKNRANAACLIMEDLGRLPISNVQKHVDDQRIVVLNNLARSILTIGENQEVEYESIYLGMRDVFVKDKEVGCALVAAPYFTLAKNAIIDNKPENLIDISLPLWENHSKGKFLT
jgi:histidine decarboxylase